MKMNECIPSNQLRPFIKSYRIIESDNDIINRVVPNTSFAMAFRIRGQVSYINADSKTILPATVFSGLRKTVRLINYAKNTATLIVLFKEQAMLSFFKEPIHELFEQSVSLDNFFSQSEILLVEERLAETKNDMLKIPVIEQFLLSKFIYHNADKLISEAIEKIHSSNGNIRIKELAKQLYISEDAFEKRFRKATGATPKQFSHIVKMNAIIRQTSANTSFLDMAFENGFCDQSHFNKDFKIFTGQTPTDFFKASLFW